MGGRYAGLGSSCPADPEHVCRGAEHPNMSCRCGAGRGQRGDGGGLRRDGGRGARAWWVVPEVAPRHRDHALKAHVGADGRASLALAQLLPVGER